VSTSYQQVEVVVASGKGGVGKSLLSSSLSIILAEKGVRLVAVDADAEAPNLHLALGVLEWDRVEPYYEGRVAYIDNAKCTNCGLCARACQLGAVEVRDGKYYINPWVCEGCYTCSFVCPVKAIRHKRGLVAGYIRVKERTIYGFPLVSGEITPGRPNSGKLVTEARNTGRKMLSGEGVILIDAAAGIGCQVISSLAGAHVLILVAEPTPASLSDLSRIHRLARHFRIPSMLVINKADLNEYYRERLIEYAREWNIDYLGDIPYDDNVPRSLSALKPLIKAYPDTPAVKAILEIGDMVAERLANIAEWRIKHMPSKPEPFTPIVLKPTG